MGPRGGGVEQSGEYSIPAERKLVWQALNDPEMLKRCIDGCQAMQKLADDEFTAVIKARVGPISARFNAALQLTDINPPEGYCINIAVKGGAAGFARGSAAVVLTDQQHMTRLRYTATASVGGKLAQIGSRLIDGAARKLANSFFKAFLVEMSVQAADTAATARQTIVNKDTK